MGFFAFVRFVMQSHLSMEGLDVKIRILVSVALALAVLAAAGLWALKTLLPRARPEGPLEEAVAGGSTEELRRELAVHPADLEDRHGFTALDWAARTGKTASIHELVHAGANPNGRDIY